MKKNKIALQIISFGLVVFTFIACDKDFATLESDVLNSDVATNFDILSETHDIITYTKALNPITNAVQTNGLGLSTLGLYDDAYGRTTSSFVAPVLPSSFNPDFGEDTMIDSVVVRMSFFNTTTDFDDDGNAIYEIDSILPKADTYNQIKLRIFENNYFLRDFNPNADIDEGQVYYSNKTAAGTGDFSSALEGEELIMIPDVQTSYLPENGPNIINISNNVYVLEEEDDDDEDSEPQVIERQIPGIRVKLDPTFWHNKIIDKEDDAVLSNLNNFADYFRGLYFKAEPVENEGSFLILDTSSSNANITIYYSSASTSDDSDDRNTSTYVLNFGSNKINFYENDFILPINSGDAETGDSKIYLKGGEGSIAGIKLFNGEDLDDAPEANTFEAFKNTYVETDDNGKFVRSKRLVNEANLVFYVDRDQLDMLGEDPNNEPNRIYVYDIDNKRPLDDFYLDAANTSLPSFSKLSHLGRLERVDEDDPESKGVKYKLRITEHINNLLIEDSTNVELGLAVSLNVNIEEVVVQNKVQESEDYTVPVSSILTPRGTILHGNNSEDETKRVQLEIYYTCPDGEDCN